MKMITVLIILFLTVNSSFAGLSGDMDNDGQVTIKDALIVLRIAIGLTPPPVSPAATLDNVQILTVDPVEWFRTSDRVDFNISFMAINNGTARANITATWQAKAPDDTVLFERSIDWGLDPGGPHPLSVSAGYFLTPSQYDSAKWIISSVVLH